MFDYKNVKFVIVGPGHSGSTWLRDNLAQVPGIYMPKETNFLTWLERFGHKLDEFYGPAINDASVLCGEHANTYFSHPHGPELVFGRNPDVKIVVMVRDPVTIVEKFYRHDVRWGVFPSFWDMEATCEFDGFYERYIGTASYSRNLKRWMKYFAADRFFLFNGEAKGERRISVFSQLLEFLNISKRIPDGFDEHKNVSAFTLFPSIHRNATFGKTALNRRVCQIVDPLNRLAGKFVAEPALTGNDRKVVSRALGEDSSLNEFLSLAREHDMAGCRSFD